MTRKTYNTVMIAMLAAEIILLGVMNLFTADIVAAGIMFPMRVALALVMGGLIWWTGFKNRPQN